MSSTRLPGKVLRPLLGQPMLARQIERVRRAEGIELVVATSDRPSDAPIVALCESLAVDCFRGPLDDVLERFVGAIRGRRGDPIIRITGDCPLADPVLIEEVLGRHRAGGVDYTSNVLERHLPDGLDVEVIEREALRKASREAVDPADREHVTRYVHRRPGRFRLRSVRHAAESEDLSAFRFTVDVEDDLRFVRAVYGALYPRNPRFGWRAALAFARGRASWQPRAEVEARV